MKTGKQPLTVTAVMAMTMAVISFFMISSRTKIYLIDQRFRLPADRRPIVSICKRQAML